MARWIVLARVDDPSERFADSDQLVDWVEYVLGEAIETGYLAVGRVRVLPDLPLGEDVNLDEMTTTAEFWR